VKVSSYCLIWLFDPKWAVLRGMSRFDLLSLLGSKRAVCKLFDSLGIFLHQKSRVLERVKKRPGCLWIKWSIFWCDMTYKNVISRLFWVQCSGQMILIIYRFLSLLSFLMFLKGRKMAVSGNQDMLDQHFYLATL